MGYCDTIDIMIKGRTDKGKIAMVEIQLICEKYDLEVETQSEHTVW